MSKKGKRIAWIAAIFVIVVIVCWMFLVWYVRHISGAA